MAARASARRPAVERVDQQLGRGSLGRLRCVGQHDQGRWELSATGRNAPGHRAQRPDGLGGRDQAFERFEIPREPGLQTLERREVPLRIAEHDPVHPQGAGRPQPDEQAHEARPVRDVALGVGVVVGPGPHRGPGEGVDRPVVGERVALVARVDRRAADRVQAAAVQGGTVAVEKLEPHGDRIVQARAEPRAGRCEVLEPDVVGELEVAGDDGDEVAEDALGRVRFARGRPPDSNRALPVRDLRGGDGRPAADDQIDPLADPGPAAHREAPAAGLALFERGVGRQVPGLEPAQPFRVRDAQRVRTGPAGLGRRPLAGEGLRGNQDQEQGRAQAFEQRSHRYRIVTFDRTLESVVDRGDWWILTITNPPSRPPLRIGGSCA